MVGCNGTKERTGIGGGDGSVGWVRDKLPFFYYILSLSFSHFSPHLHLFISLSLSSFLFLFYFSNVDKLIYASHK